ncbi:hypothetical protein PINS_up022488 [Pythium insidiosum]|nr:hypothetical protein PINS_up022488 [Pythium insidiosum]
MTVSAAKHQQLRHETSATKNASTAAPILVVVKHIRIATAAKPDNVVVHGLTEMKTKRQALTIIVTEGLDKVEKISRKCRTKRRVSRPAI